MFNLDNYFQIFNYSILFLVVFTSIELILSTYYHRAIWRINSLFGYIFTILLIFYIGLRPVDRTYFTDMENYANKFELAKQSIFFDALSERGDVVFEWIVRIVSIYGELHHFFLFCAAIYIIPLVLATKNIFKKNFWIPLLLIFSMFNFMAYGTNVMRSGMAISIAILALSSYKKSKKVQIILFAIAFGIHQSTIIFPIFWYICSYYNKVKYFLAMWVASIVIAIFFGGFIKSSILRIGFFTNRISSYINNDSQSNYNITGGIRWDFILYSSLGVIVGWYFIYIKKFTDEFYIKLYCMYLAMNCSWILINDIIFSDRFAALSWSLMPLVLIYPIMRYRFWRNQQSITGFALLLFYAFSFYINILKIK